MREEGYYWVKPFHSEWQIMEWMQTSKNTGFFAVIRDEFTSYTNNELEKIDEKRIIR